MTVNSINQTTETWNRNRVQLAEVKTVKRPVKPKQRIVNLDEFYADVEPSKSATVSSKGEESGSSETDSGMTDSDSSDDSI